MNTVATILWGWWEEADGGVGYVHALKHAVRQFSSESVRFILFTDHPRQEFDHDIEVYPLEVPRDWRGNYKKMILFRPNNGLTGRVVSMDLDTVLLGNIDCLFQAEGVFITCEDPYHLRWVGGGIHAFDAGWGSDILWYPMQQNHRSHLELSKGSERLYLKHQFKMHGVPVKFWQRELPGKVVSFKADCKDNLKGDESVVWFHGIPRPHHVRRLPWVDQYFRRAEDAK